MSDPATILARLKALTGSDREVDYEIAGALFRLRRVSKELERSLGYHPGGIEPQMIVERRFGPDTEPIPHWTASIDAALALIDKVLPDVERWSRQLWLVGIELDEARARPKFRLWNNDGNNIEVRGNTPALAILIALFTYLSDTSAALATASEEPPHGR